MTVGEMQDRMSNLEFVQWQAFYARRSQREELAARAAKRGR
jgi:hypothetical protein